MAPPRRKCARKVNYVCLSDDDDDEDLKVCVIHKSNKNLNTVEKNEVEVLSFSISDDELSITSSPTKPFQSSIKSAIEDKSSCFVAEQSHSSTEPTSEDETPCPTGTPKTKEKQNTRRGIALLSDDEEDDDGESILPQAAIFNACITEYRKNLYCPKERLKTEVKDDSKKNKDQKGNNKAADKDKDTNSACVKSDNTPEKPSPVSKTLKNKLNKIRRQINMQRVRNQRLCSFVLPDESNDHDNTLSDDDLTCSNGDGDLETVVKVQCRRDILRFVLKRNEQFGKIFEEIAKKYKVGVSEVMLCLKDNKIDLEDTPSKLNLSIADILECCLLSTETSRSVNKHNFINVKIQSNDTKTPSVFTIHKLEPFSVVMEKYSKKHDIPLEWMSFEFDGEKINPNENCTQLELENESVVDVRIS